MTEFRFQQYTFLFHRLMGIGLWEPSAHHDPVSFGKSVLQVQEVIIPAICLYLRFLIFNLVKHAQSPFKQ